MLKVTTLAVSTAQRATELLALGYTAYRAGNYARARKHFERAVALYEQDGADAHPDALTALSDIGAACSAMGDLRAARAAHETALQRRRETLGENHQDVGISLHNLGAVFQALGDLQAAEQHQLQALSLWRRTLGGEHPFVARALDGLCRLALQRGQNDAATAYARQVLDIRTRSLPAGDAAIAAAHDVLATALAHAGNTVEAIPHWQAALTNTTSRDSNQTAARQVRLGTAQRRIGQLEAAAASFAAAIELDPALTAAQHQLAVTLARLGREAEAHTIRAHALRRGNVFVDGADAHAPSVLIPSIADDGNIPLGHLLPEHAYTRIWWFIDHARNPTTETLPRYDLVLNAIGDPDMSGRADAKLASFRLACRTPFLNHPARIAETRRDRMPALLGNIDGLQTPSVERLNHPVSGQDVQQAVSAFGFTFPLLLRPAGAHGGRGVMRIDEFPALAQWPSGDRRAWYLSALHDCRAPDGFFRKYRIIFVDRQPLPYHLAISPDWLVHYYTSEMEAHPWKLAEEAEFLNDPGAALGDRAWAALRQAGQRLDLDFCGMDFTLQTDGTVLVFEANATMLVHPEKPDGPFAFKNPAVQRITGALHDLITARIAD